MIMLVVIPLLVAYLAYVAWYKLFPAPRVSLSTPRWVLITGCDTGFGASLATRLHNLGYHVIATCLTPAAVSSYQALNSPRMLSVQLDVTREEDIARVQEFVRQHTFSLHALVNNAGIAAGWMIDGTSMATYHRVANVNLFGGIAMTKMCIPFLLQGKDSRVVTVTSMAGLSAAPGMSSYNVSKFGMEGFMDCFRREMRPFGIKASIIEPAFMSTPLVLGAAQMTAREWDNFPEDVKQRWGRPFFDSAVANAARLMASTMESPEKAVDDMVDAVTSTKPWIRYRPGWGAKLLFPLSLLPGAVQDWINELARGRGKQVPAFIAQAQQQGKL